MRYADKNAMELPTMPVFEIKYGIAMTPLPIPFPATTAEAEKTDLFFIFFRVSGLLLPGLYTIVIYGFIRIYA